MTVEQAKTQLRVVVPIEEEEEEDSKTLIKMKYAKNHDTHTLNIKSY
jgi:hypothetical protein